VRLDNPGVKHGIWSSLVLLALSACSAPDPTPDRTSEVAEEVVVEPVRVLPVFIYPAGAQVMPPADLALAKANYSAHLQMARRMYQRMLRNPFTTAPRGTFSLASWSTGMGTAVPVSDYYATLTPLEVQVPQTTNQILMSAAQPTGELDFLHSVMNAAGCTQMTCRFVFAVVVVDGPNFTSFALKLNQGFDSGGGVTLFPWSIVKAANRGGASCYQLPASSWAREGCEHFLSTLVHEVGHSFGLNHTHEYGGSGPLYDRVTSPSIMADQSTANWIPGCGPGNEAPNDSTPCVYPASHSLIDDPPIGHFSGELLPDDMRVLGLNHGVIPFEFIPPLYTPTGHQILYQWSAGYAKVPGQERLLLTSEWDGLHLVEWVVGLPIMHIWEPLVGHRRWKSTTGAVGTWADIDVEFPWSVELTNVRLYAGSPGADQYAPTHARVLRIDNGSPGIPLGPTQPFPTLDQSIPLPTHAAPDRYRIQLARGASTYASLRGIRFWGKKNGGSVEELFPAVEPTAVVEGGIWGGSPSNIIGSNQEVKSYAAAWDAATSWHSDAVSCGNWVSVTVTFPEEVHLAHVKAHTGHSGTYHPAHTVQIERECTCNPNSISGGNCTVASAFNCTAAGGNGSQVFEYVTSKLSTPDELVTFTSRKSHRWKVAMRTTPGAGQCYVNVRGLRFFNQSGLELYPARLLAPGL
jgi:hypothetical protein